MARHVIKPASYLLKTVVRVPVVTMLRQRFISPKEKISRPFLSSSINRHDTEHSQ